MGKDTFFPLLVSIFEFKSIKSLESAPFSVLLEPLEEKMVHHLIVVPEDIAAAFIAGKGAPRILCSIEGSPEFPCALNPRHGRHVIIASKQLIRKNKLLVGVPFSISIRLDASNGLRLPEELAEVLDQDEAACRAYTELNDGRKRGLIYYINQARSVDSRIKRSLESMEKIKQRGKSS